MVNNSIKILQILMENSEVEFNIAKISRHSKIDYKNVYSILHKLEAEGIITLETFGKNKRIVLNKKIHPLIFEAEFKRREKLLKNKDFLILTNKLSLLAFPFIILLFGSYAKGKARKGSDIDLLIICEEKRVAKVRETIDLFPLKIHPTFINFNEFEKMMKTKEFNVVSEAVKNNIPLVGIEDYYRLIENAE